jgi:hypothetical protein
MLGLDIFAGYASVVLLTNLGNYIYPQIYYNIKHQAQPSRTELWTQEKNVRITDHIVVSMLGTNAIKKSYVIVLCN